MKSDRIPLPNQANFPPRPQSVTPDLDQPVFASGLDGESQFVYGEDRNEFYLLQRQYIQRFLPRSPEERYQVDKLIRNEWSLRRLFRAEPHLWEYHIIRSDPSEGVVLGAAFDKASQVFMRLQRRITLAEKSYEDAFKELKRLQADRAPSPPAPSVSEPAPGPEPEPEPAPALVPAPPPAKTSGSQPQPVAVIDIAGDLHQQPPAPPHSVGVPRNSGFSPTKRSIRPATPRQPVGLL